LGDKSLAIEDVGEVVARTFVDELRKEDINAVFTSEAPPLDNEDLLVAGAVTDYIHHLPFFWPALRRQVKFGMSISLLDSAGSTLVTRQFAKGYRIFGVPPREALDVGLRRFCREAIEDHALGELMERLRDRPPTAQPSGAPEGRLPSLDGDGRGAPTGACPSSKPHPGGSVPSEFSVRGSRIPKSASMMNPTAM
jgi:hypothetical protein